VTGTAALNTGMIEVVDPGALCTVQDRGRPGWAHLGVGHSGALDRAAAALANRLVGNHDDAAVLESTFGGTRLRFRSAVFIAVTGAECAITVDGASGMGMRQPVALPPDSEIALGPPMAGVRTYIAVRGGIAVEPVMGSRSTDLLSHVGPEPLVSGSTLSIGADPGTPVPTAFAPPSAVTNWPLTIWPGPRTDWFSDNAQRTLVQSPYVVLPSSNRIGVRLSGVALERLDDRELPSEGIVDGAIQVPNDGQPLVFLADHPTTGGYPVIAVVDPGDLDRLAQVRPGDTVRFRWRR